MRKLSQLIKKKGIILLVIFVFVIMTSLFFWRRRMEGMTQQQCLTSPECSSYTKYIANNQKCISDGCNRPLPTFDEINRATVIDISGVTAALNLPIASAATIKSSPIPVAKSVPAKKTIKAPAPTKKNKPK
jgi:hypothetical protein